MKSYSRIHLRQTARWLPGWRVNNEMRTPYMHAYESPEYTITRESGEPSYLVTHKESGEQCEVPVANVRAAVLVVEPPKPAPLPQTKGKR